MLEEYCWNSLHLNLHLLYSEHNRFKKEIITWLIRSILKLNSPSLKLLRPLDQHNVLKTKIQPKMGLNWGQTIIAVIYRYPIFAGLTCSITRLLPSVTMRILMTCSMSITALNTWVAFSFSYNKNNNLLLPPMSKQLFNHHKFMKHHTLTTILKPTMKAYPLTHQTQTW